MNLAEDDIEYIKNHIPQWLAAQSLSSPPAVYEVELRERTIRVEEELKHQRELMQQGFQQMEKRFEQVDKRFEQVDKRFESIQQQMDKRFESMQKQMDKRFEQVDKRFEVIQSNINKIATRHDRMQWGIFLAVIGVFFKDKLLPLVGG